MRNTVRLSQAIIQIEIGTIFYLLENKPIQSSNSSGIMTNLVDFRNNPTIFRKIRI